MTIGSVARFPHPQRAQNSPPRFQNTRMTGCNQYENGCQHGECVHSRSHKTLLLPCGPPHPLSPSCGRANISFEMALGHSSTSASVGREQRDRERAPSLAYGGLNTLDTQSWCSKSFSYHIMTIGSTAVSGNKPVRAWLAKPNVSSGLGSRNQPSKPSHRCRSKEFSTMSNVSTLQRVLLVCTDALRKKQEPSRPNKRRRVHLLRNQRMPKYVPAS